MKKAYFFMKRLVFKLMALRAFLKTEIGINSNINIFKRLWLLLHGFNSDKAISYNLSKGQHKLYLSDYRRRKTSLSNGDFNIVLSNKLLFENVFSSAFEIPTNYAVISKGVINKLSKDSPIYDFESLYRFLKKQKSIVIKPIGGSTGYKVYIFKYIDNKFFKNNEEINYDSFRELVSTCDDFFISEYVVQSEFSKSLFPDTTNTIRVLLYRSISDNKMKILAASQRIGTSKSKGMDNISSGGVSAQIDVETGTILNSVSIQNYKDKSTEIIKNIHPESKMNLIGLKIPNWQEISNDICNNFDYFPYINFVGLDIVITENGYSVIEGNSFSNPRIHQLHEPLLAYDDFNEFLKYHRI